MTLFWKMLYIVKIFVNFYEVILYKLDKSVCVYIYTMYTDTPGDSFQLID